MRPNSTLLAACALAVTLATPVFGQSANAAQTPADTANDPIRTLVSRLELEKYKATIKGLTQFGDRQQGTERNRRAVDWIEAQLKSFGCTNTERIKYEYNPPPQQQQQRPVTAADSAAVAARRAAAARNTQAAGGGRIRGNRGRTGAN